MAGLVYTAIFGDYDTPKAMTHPEKGVDYWMFTDGKGADGWDIQRRGGSKRSIEHARLIKVMTPAIHEDYDWYFWVDGSMQIQAPIKALVERSLKAHDFAAFKHPEWQCAYTEIEKCEKRRKDSPKRLAKALSLLERFKFPYNFGQLATGILARANSDKVRGQAGLWWGSIQESSMRDQCTFMLNLWRMESYIEWFPGDYRRNKWFKYFRGHL